MAVRTYKVYVGNLGENGRKEEIEKEFEKYGRLHDVWVARNPPGFAFVEFEDLRDAEDAIKDLDGKHICGARVRVEMSRHRGGRGGRGGGRGRYEDRGRRFEERSYDRYDDRSRSPYRSPPRRRGRSPEMDRWQSRGGRSRSRSPRRF